MKKIICFIMTLALLLSSLSVAYAKQGNTKEQMKQQKKTEQQITTNNKVQQKVQQKEQKKDLEEQQEQDSEDQQKLEEQQNSKNQKNQKQEISNSKIKEKKQTFKIKGSPTIKYGKYKLPINPVKKGMGANVTFDKETALLTVTKAATTIIINFKEKTVTVNGVADTNSGIFTASNSKKSTVLIKYIANKLGVRVNADDDKITVTVPGLDLPKGITVTPVGSTVVDNTLNTTTLYMTATANITAGQAVKAELYVGSKLVATDSEIATTDKVVTFTTSDGTPTNTELQLAVPEGGVITVKLYNANNESVTSKAYKRLVVDYVAPTITSISGAALSVSGSAITLNVTGAGAIMDRVDVSKISLFDTALNKTYQLTNAAGTGSTGIVYSDSLLTIRLGSADFLGLEGFGGSTVFLNIAADAFLFDMAGNTSQAFTTVQTVPVTVTK